MPRSSDLMRRFAEPAPLSSKALISTFCDVYDTIGPKLKRSNAKSYPAVRNAEEFRSDAQVRGARAAFVEGIDFDVLRRVRHHRAEVEAIEREVVSGGQECRGVQI